MDSYYAILITEAAALGLSSSMIVVENCSAPSAWETLKCPCLWIQFCPSINNKSKNKRCSIRSVTLSLFLESREWIFRAPCIHEAVSWHNLLPLPSASAQTPASGWTVHSLNKEWWNSSFLTVIHNLAATPHLFLSFCRIHTLWGKSSPHSFLQIHLNSCHVLSTLLNLHIVDVSNC